MIPRVRRSRSTMCEEKAYPLSGYLLPFALHSDTVHVWIFRLDVSDWRYRLASIWLSDDELERAERYVFEEQRRRFVVCRTTLRLILGSYLERAPHEVRFAQGRHGKPQLDAAQADGFIHFNVSHSDGLALVAVSRERELGVDLEYVRPLDGIDDIVAHHFAPAERLAFSRVPLPSRLSEFYAYWTLKEAYLKACGDGLSRTLSEVDVTQAPNHPIHLSGPSGAGAGRYWLGRSLEPAAGYQGALVVEGREGVPATTMIAWPNLPTSKPHLGSRQSAIYLDT